MAPRIALLLSLIVVSGCFSTHLRQETNTADLQRLVGSTERKLLLQVHNPFKDSSLGYQYLLGILPLARIFTDTMYETVVAKLQYHAGKDGLGLPARPELSSTTPRLEVTIVSAAVNGYDLIFVRRPAAGVTLRGTLFTSTGDEFTCERSGSEATTSRFAFASDLNQVFESAVDTASAQLLDCLHLTSQQASNGSVGLSYTSDIGSRS